jgi:cellulose synthase/poly-beta-1,6-N-acetylglucosamine synthase-like glycosyltransferase
MTGLAIGVLAVVALLLAALPAVLTAFNLRAFARAPAGEPARVSVLVPARNEERAIGRLCHDVLASEGVDLELVILDDDSHDATREIVSGIAAVGKPPASAKIPSSSFS